MIYHVDSDHFYTFLKDFTKWQERMDRKTPEQKCLSYVDRINNGRTTL